MKLQIIPIILIILFLFGCVSTPQNSNSQQTIQSNSQEEFTNVQNQTNNGQLEQPIKQSVGENAQYIDNAEINYIEKDSKDNLFFLGRALEDLSFDGTNINATKNQLFILKTDSSINSSWVKNISKKNLARAIDLTIDFEDNVLFGIHFEDEITIDTHQLKVTPEDTPEAFAIIKLSNNGNYLDGQIIETTHTLRVASIEAVGTGVVVTGYYKGKVTFNEELIFENKKGSSFTLFIDKEGNVKWKKDYGGDKLTVDSENNIIVSGTTSFPLNTENFTLLFNGLKSMTFLIKLDSEGKEIWGKNMNLSAASNTITDIAVDKDDKIYLTGATTDDISLDSCSTKHLKPGTSIHILKLGSDGTCEWSKLAEGPHSDLGKSISVSQDGFLLVTGYIEGALSIDDTSLSGLMQGASANYAGIILEVSGQGELLNQITIAPSKNSEYNVSVFESIILNDKKYFLELVVEKKF